MIILQEIFGILNEKIGLNPSSIGASSIERAINHRIVHNKCNSLREYLLLLQSNTKEVRELIEEVVVPETWFFRNRVPFEAYVQHVKNELLPKAYKKKPVRILSVPCATGEEPYSLAIALLEEKIDPGYFRIDAMDVSRRSIAIAKDAFYGKNSFRDPNTTIRDKYFTSKDRGWLLNESVKKLVKFKQGNVLLGSLSPHPGYYDVIFCRNLLIYFDRVRQQEAVEKLYRSLKKGAILFVGHAETSQVSEQYFERSKYSRSFSFIKRDKPIKDLAELTKTLSGIGVAQKPGKAAGDSIVDIVKLPHSDQITNGAITIKSTIKSTTIKPIMESLRPAEKLANEGRYAEAATMCRDFLKHQPESAHAHYLLGLINNAQGDSKAAESLLKKAIYLDPNHEQALVLSCLIAEQKGDEEAIKSYKRRIERVRNRNKGNMG